MKYYRLVGTRVIVYNVREQISAEDVHLHLQRKQGAR